MVVFSGPRKSTYPGKKNRYGHPIFHLVLVHRVTVFSKVNVTLNSIFIILLYYLFANKLNYFGYLHPPSPKETVTGP